MIDPLQASSASVLAPATPEPCREFVSHPVCILVCQRCWRDWDAHVAARERRELDRAMLDAIVTGRLAVFMAEAARRESERQMSLTAVATCADVPSGILRGGDE